MPALIALAVLVVVLLRLAFASGGYFPADHVEAAVIVFVALAVLLAVALPRRAPSRGALVALGLLAAFTAWTGVSASWSPVPDEALGDLRRALLAIGILALALLAAGTGRRAALLPWAALGVCCVVCGAGLASRLAPDLVSAPAAGPRLGGFRLDHPLTYWNAFGTMAAFGALLAAGLAADPRLAAWRRALGTALAVVLVVAMYLSLSRGAWLALLLGAVALVVLTPHRVSALLTLGLVAAGAGLAIARLGAYPVLVDGPAGGRQADDGAAFALQLGVLALAAGGAQLALAGARRSPALADLVRRTRTAAIAGGAAVAVVVAVAGYATAGDRVEGRSAAALGDGSSWLERQWEDFLQTSSYSAGGAQRLLTTRGTRSDLYRVALDGFRDNPLRGDGAGAWSWRWFQTREAVEDTREPHSLWLGTLGELGLVGAALLLGFVAALGRAAARGLRRPGALRRGETAAVAAAVLAFFAHAAIDWDWSMPALSGTVLLAAAALLPPGRTRRRVRR
jgi:O-antigen ligase